MGWRDKWEVFIVERNKKIDYIIQLDVHASKLTIKEKRTEKNRFVAMIRSFIKEERMRQAKLPKTLYLPLAKRYVPSGETITLYAPENRMIRLFKNRNIMMRYFSKEEHVVLMIDATQMSRDGYRFIQSIQGIWYTEELPARYTEIIDETQNMQ